ncbi:MAG: hypothetical protein AAB416_05235 [Patescibacteria group bacterium]
MKKLNELGPIFPLLIPCFVFTEPVKANEYIRDLRSALTPKQLKNVTVVKSGTETYISVPDWQQYVRFLQDHLVFLSLQQEEGIWEVTIGKKRRQGFRVPKGAEVSFIALQGVHLYTRVVRRMPDSLTWLQKAIHGPKECATACGGADTLLKNVETVPRNDGRQPLTAFAGKEGRMVVVTTELLYEEVLAECIGCAIGAISHVFFLSFAPIKSRDGGVSVRIFCKWLTGRSDDPDTPEIPEVFGMDPTWQRLYHKACKQFKQSCVAFARSAEDGRLLARARIEHELFFARHRELKQKVARDHDTFGAWWQTLRSLGGANLSRRRTQLIRGFLPSRVEIADLFTGNLPRFMSYRRRVCSLGWDDALATVRESWQLYVVFQEHLWERGRMVSLEDTRSLFWQLLECHPCTEERRTQLWSMAENDIAPNDRFWDPSELP